MHVSRAMAAVLGLVLIGAAPESTLNDRVRQIRDIALGAVSPDAKQVAAVITDTTEAGGRTHIWLLSADGTSSRQATFSTADDEPGETAPVFAPDGAWLYFQATRGGVRRLYRLPLAGGEAEALHLGRKAAGGLQAAWAAPAEEAPDVVPRTLEVSPNGSTLALIAQDGDTATQKADKKKKNDAVRIGSDDRKLVRLYLIDAASGGAREVSLPDDVQSVRWNAAGDTLLAVTAPQDDDLGPSARLWRVSAASLSAVPLPNVPKTLQGAEWAASGIAYEAQCAIDSPPGCLDLFFYDTASGTSRDLTAGLQGSIEKDFFVDADGTHVVTTIYTGFQQRLARIGLMDGVISFVGFPLPVAHAAQANAGRTLYAVLGSSPLQPNAIYVMKQLGDTSVQLAGPDIVPKGFPAVPAQSLTWKSGGVMIEGALYMPALAAGARAPLIVDVHGGPTGIFIKRYSTLVNLLVAQGWAVLQTNPRGSLGYGAAFAAANRNDLGGADFSDIMAGVDEALARYPLDPQRMALIGYSYGGEMAGFAEGKTDRFKAIVSGAPVIDQFSEYGTEDSSFYDRWYFGKPWEHFADAWRQSPLAGVSHARTPLLLLQGENDPTDPLGQSQEMRRAMRQIGAPVALITYPRETHATLGQAFSGVPTREPWHGVDLRRRMIQFISDAFAGKTPTAE